MSKRVITFGEIMLRLAPNGYYRFFQNDQMQATFGGGEANVAVSLANYGLDSAYVTKLPSHAIGQAAVDSLRYFGVDTSMIVRGGDRVGIYYLEKGASQRGSVCIMTAPTPPSRKHSPLTLTGRLFSTGGLVPLYRYHTRPRSQPDSHLRRCLQGRQSQRRQGLL